MKEWQSDNEDGSRCVSTMKMAAAACRVRLNGSFEMNGWILCKTPMRGCYNTVVSDYPSILNVYVHAGIQEAHQDESNTVQAIMVPRSRGACGVTEAGRDGEEEEEEDHMNGADGVAQSLLQLG